MNLRTCLILFIILTISSCQQEQNNLSPILLEQKKDLVKNEYNKVIKRLHHLKSIQKRKLSSNKNSTLIDTRIQLETYIADSLVPFWLGTKWDYNGITQQPFEGEIACGYFVNTILQHIGFDFNRIRLSQKPSIYILESFCKKENIKRIGRSDKKAIQTYLKDKKNRIFICGLDNHVGLIINYAKKWYAVHASGIHPQEVVIEPLFESRGFMQSKNYFIAPLFEDNFLLASWILDVKVKEKA